MVAQNEPLVYLHNETASAVGHFVSLDLAGTKTNHEGVGASVTIVAGGRKQLRQRVGGGSYQSASDPRLHFGLGRANRIDRLEIRWPSGTRDVFRNLEADKFYRVTEGAPIPQTVQASRKK